MSNIIKHAYQIRCQTNGELVERMGILLSKGLVFTNERIRTIENMKREYSGSWPLWHYIQIGHHSSCIRIMNTSPNPKTSYGYIPFFSLSFDSFVSDILPTL